MKNDIANYEDGIRLQNESIAKSLERLERVKKEVESSNAYSESRIHELQKKIELCKSDIQDCSNSIKKLQSE